MFITVGTLKGFLSMNVISKVPSKVMSFEIQSFITVGTLTRVSLLNVVLQCLVRLFFSENPLLQWESLKGFLSCMCSKVPSKVITFEKILYYSGNT